MDHLALPAPKAKRRRRHSPEFKRKVVDESCEPGVSIAGVARDYQINANLLHKWRRELLSAGCDGFVRIPVVGNVGSEVKPNGEIVRVELPGGITVHWPLHRIRESVDWLKAMMMS